MTDRELSAEELEERRQLVYEIRDDAVEVLGLEGAAALLLSLAQDLGDQLGIPRDEQARDFAAAWARAAARAAKRSGH